MQIQKIKVPLYKSVIITVVLSGEESSGEVCKYLSKIGVRSNEVLADITKNLDLKTYNGAECMWNERLGLNIILIYPHISKKEFFISMYHELRHAIDNIATSTDLKGDEALAYLTGYIYWEATKNYFDYEPSKII